MRHVLRRLTTAGLLAAGLVAVTSPAMAAPAEHSGTARGEGSAYGLTAIGAVPLAPVPAVSSRSGAARKSLLREDRTEYVQASALDVMARAGHASSSVARLNVPPAGLTAGAVTATCDGGRGATHLTDALVAGRRLDAAPPPNTTVPVDVEGVGRTSLILNKQQRMRDGRLAVTGMELNLPLSKVAKDSTVRIASATCGQAAAPRPHAHPRPRPAAEAPAPTPVKRDLPVAG
ncbi:MULTISPECIES: choice-of-anchor P family protein [Actinomadura]|uniref:choice-of-anchor P family protein n=1 Tax=Actinomadura TaxID=1988 RepID=UPI001FE3AB65|nr:MULTISPECIES: choice-of-anchor P family protein [Actinomadura]